MKQVVMVDPNVHPLFQALFLTPRTLKYGLRRKWKQSVSFRRIDLHQMPHGDQYIVGLKGPMLRAGLRCGIVVPLFRSSRSDVPYRPIGQSRTQTETVPHAMNERGRSRMSRTILSTSRDPGLSVAGGKKRGSVNGSVNKLMTGGTGRGLDQIRGISAVVKRSVRVGASNVGECQPDGHLGILSSFFSFPQLRRYRQSGTTLFLVCAEFG
ncbi:hypothetical protein QBC45DRAFT_402997 [Copromyces sp. CBS 386.78]|nr:hypothetical protein QBC45DRAFT_402997 [Copromyces sp. CBS 386.78]